MEQVVTVEAFENGTIVQIKMEDRKARNTFSKGIIEGIFKAFGSLNTYPNCKVVLLTGYENYFSCGGTLDELMAIYKGEMSFNDLNFFTLPLECELPVISAMQGHGIGGGFVFGLYADFPILAKESIYTANFMKYGFTPGMGGTLLIPSRLGEMVGNEMLYTAETYRGGELQERGIPLKVVSRNEVWETAYSLAKTLAEKPRESLITLKKHLTVKLKAELPGVIEAELAMHELTVHQPEVREKINALFGQ